MTDSIEHPYQSGEGHPRDGRRQFTIRLHERQAWMLATIKEAMQDQYPYFPADMSWNNFITFMLEEAIEKVTPILREMQQSYPQPEDISQ